MKKHAILVVDDEPLNVKLLSAMLPSDKYEKISANGGAEALSLLGSCHPDLILLDFMMSGMDGCAVTEKIKSDEKTRDIPVMQITAMDGIEIKRSLRQKSFLSLLMLKVLYEKNVKSNDTHPHVSNLKFKKAIADIIKRNIRDIDLASFNDENCYMVLMTHSEANHAKIVGDRLKREIEESAEFENTTYELLNVAYAIAQCPNDFDTKAELIHLAQSHLK